MELGKCKSGASQELGAHFRRRKNPRQRQIDGLVRRFPEAFIGRGRPSSRLHSIRWGKPDRSFTVYGLLDLYIEYRKWKNTRAKSRPEWRSRKILRPGEKEKGDEGHPGVRLFFTINAQA